ncbi:hypothetical protein [Cetobacterium ceti]
MEFFKKHKKLIAIIIPLFILWGIYYNVKNNLPIVVEKILKIALGPEISSTSITFPKFGEIDIKNAKLVDKGKLIVDAPEIKILYSKKSLKDFSLEAIDVYNPYVVIERKDADLNIADAFSSDKKDNKDDTKAGTNVPIGIIRVFNGDVLYRDLSYSRPIEKLVHNIDGYVSFNKKLGIKLEYSGDIEKKQYFKYSFNNYKKEYSMNILLKDVNLDDKLLQFAYDDKDLENVKGIVNLDLTIDSDGLYGKGDFSNGGVTYKNLDYRVTNIDGKVDFLGNKIDLKSTYDIFGSKGKFNVNYSEEKGVDVDFILNNLKYSDLEKYKLLGELKLPLNFLEFKNVLINLNYNKKKEFSVNIDFNCDPLKFTGGKVQNIKGKFIYKNDKIYLNGINLNVIYKSKFIDYNRTFILNSELIPKDEGLDFIVDSQWGKFKGEFSKEKQNVKIYSQNKNVFQMDLKSGNINIEKLKLKNFIENYSLNISGEKIKNDINIKNLELRDEDSEILGSGFYNLENKNYEIDYIGKNINSERLKFLKNINFSGNTFGKIKGEKDKFILENQLEDFSGSFEEFKIKNLRTYTLIKNEKKILGDFQGTIEKISYGKYHLDGIRFGGQYKNKIISIVNLNNQILSLKGNVNLNTMDVNGQYSLNNITEEKFNLKNIKFNLKNVDGNISGKINNPTVTLGLKNGEIYTNNGKNINLYGNLLLKDKVIKTDKFYINESFIEGKYNLENKIGDWKIQLFEENLPKYFSKELINFRVLGRIVGKIDNTHIKTYGMVTIDSGFYKENKLPKIKSEIQYESKNYSDGNIKFKYINIYNEEMKKLLNITGLINLKENKLDFILNKQKLDLKDIEEYTKSKEIKGSINLQGELKGPFDKIKYKAYIKDGKIQVGDIIFDKLETFISGDKENLKLNYFKFNYLGNFLTSSGDFNIDNKKYNFTLKSNKIDLSFLEIFLKKYHLGKINGIANLNLTLTENSNKGYLEINNFNLTNEKYGVYLSNLNIKGELAGKFLKLSKFEGSLNKGKVSAEGYLTIPSINKIETDPDIWKNLDYYIGLKLDKVHYKYEDYFDLTLSTNLKTRENKLYGDITINNGLVKGIPYGNKSLIKIIWEFIYDKTKALITKSKDLGKDFEIKSEIETKLQLDIGFNIEKGIKLDIDQLNPVVQGVQGTILGSGFLRGKDNKLNLTGEVDWKNGQFTLGNNQFDISRALVLFSNKEEYIPDVNPTIIFEANTLTDTGRIEVSVLGTLKNLTMNIRSNQGVSSSNLSALITGNNIQSETTATAFIMKSIIDSQISDMLLRPISTTVKDVFHISKFRLVSNIVNLNDTQDDNNDKGNNFGFGAYLEAENPIYKQEYFWIAKVAVAQSTQESARDKENNQATVNDYDLKVERRFPSGWSWGIGVAQLPRDSTITEERTGKLNYYIDFKFERKYNSLVDIFKRE